MFLAYFRRDFTFLGGALAMLDIPCPRFVFVTQRQRLSTLEAMERAVEVCAGLGLEEETSSAPGELSRWYNEVNRLALGEQPPEFTDQQCVAGAGVSRRVATLHTQASRTCLPVACIMLHKSNQHALSPHFVSTVLYSHPPAEKPSETLLSVDHRRAPSHWRKPFTCPVTEILSRFLAPAARPEFARRFRRKWSSTQCRQECFHDSALTRNHVRLRDS